MVSESPEDRDESSSVDDLLERLTAGGDPGAAKRLAALASADESRSSTLAAVRTTLGGTDRSALKPLIRPLLRFEPFYRDPEVLRLAARLAGSGLRRHLQRHVFPRVHGLSPVHDAVYVGITLRDGPSRRRYLDELGEAMSHGDAEAVEAHRRAATWWKVPSGFEVQQWHIGSGKTSRVARLRRSSDGAEFAWKIPADDGEATLEVLRVLVKRSHEWGRLGVSDAEAKIAEDGRTLLQPFVPGPTLQEELRSEMLQGEANHPRRVALAETLRSLAQQKTFISGLNASNLVFSDGRWQVIDSGLIQPAKTVVEAWYRQRREAIHHWHRFAPNDRLDEFLNEIESTLDLPPLAGVRYTLTRIRRSLPLGKGPKI